MDLIYSEFPHRRFNILTGEWVLVSSHRGKRPWLGKIEKLAIDKRKSYDPECYLCAGNLRVNGKRNPNYTSTFIFDNDFPALLPEKVNFPESTSKYFRSRDVSGICRVVCFSPRHDLTLANLSEREICQIIDVWAEQTTELGKQYCWVQIFENKGDIMGCSNPHPHGQIWASSDLPTEPAKEDRYQQEYFQEEKKVMLIDYLEHEIVASERVVLENDNWVVLVPFWAVWPFETLVLPRSHVLRMPDLIANQRKDLAAILKILLLKYDRLFGVSFPYSAGWHGAPYLERVCDGWQLHGHFYPPLLRSSTVKKFMVGYEMLAEVQRDITPESTAEILKLI